MQAAGRKKTGLSQSWPLSATVLPYQKSYPHWYNMAKWLWRVTHHLLIGF